MFCKASLPSHDDGSHAANCHVLQRILSIELPPQCALCDVCFEVVEEEVLADHNVAHQLEASMYSEINVVNPPRRPETQVAPNIEQRLRDRDMRCSMEEQAVQILNLQDSLNMRNSMIEEAMQIVYLQDLIKSMSISGDAGLPPQPQISNPPVPQERAARQLPRRSEGNECTICCDPINRSRRALALECSHVFHADCIQEWLKAKAICPVCRTAVV